MRFMKLFAGELAVRLPAGVFLVPPCPPYGGVVVGCFRLLPRAVVHPASSSSCGLMSIPSTVMVPGMVTLVSSSLGRPGVCTGTVQERRRRGHLVLPAQQRWRLHTTRRLAQRLQRFRVTQNGERCTHRSKSSLGGFLRTCRFRKGIVFVGPFRKNCRKH